MAGPACSSAARETEAEGSLELEHCTAQLYGKTYMLHVHTCVWDNLYPLLYAESLESNVDLLFCLF